MFRWRDRVSLATSGALPIGDVVARFASVYEDRPLVEEGDLRLTYTQAAQMVDGWAAAIAARAGVGDRVVVATPNGYEQFLLSVAACRAGAVAVPVNSHMRPEEVDHVIADSGAVAVLREAPAPLEAGSFPAVDTEAVAAIFYTSGTTGKPKGVELTHKALAGQLTAMAVVPTGLRRDELVASLPVAHIMGFAVLLAGVAAGVPIYFLRKFNAGDVLDAIEQRRSTVFIGVPAMYRLLLEAGAEERDLSSIRVWASGADVMPPDLARRFQKMGAFATLPVVGSVGAAAFVEGYGMVETAGAVMGRISPPGFAFSLPVIGGMLGVPLPGYRTKVVDEDGNVVPVGQIGELMVRGPGVLTAYHGDPDATAAVVDGEGWLRTGDLARRGPMGLVSFAGRAKDVIKSGGYSVYAVELERAMEEHPAVAEAAAVGVPDERLGEVPAVAVRVHAGAKVTEDELIAWGSEHLSGYKRPRMVRIVDELPRTGTEKVAKRRLVDHFV